MSTPLETFVKQRLQQLHHQCLENSLAPMLVLAGHPETGGLAILGFQVYTREEVLQMLHDYFRQVEKMPEGSVVVGENFIQKITAKA